MMMRHGTELGMSAFGSLSLLGGVLFLALIVVVVALAVRYLTRTNPPTPGSWAGQAAPPPLTANRPEPLEILHERFARGEITLDEFDTAKGALGYPSSPQPPPGLG
jgi:uncharacterized membrane protein